MILTGSAFDACLSLISSQTIHKFGIYKQNDFSLAQEWIHEFLPSILLHEQLNFFFCREYCTFYMRCAPWFFGTKIKFEKFGTKIKFEKKLHFFLETNIKASKSNMMLSKRPKTQLMCLLYFIFFGADCWNCEKRVARSRSWDFEWFWVKGWRFDFLFECWQFWIPF
jgi:hypothetical protein